MHAAAASHCAACERMRRTAVRRYWSTSSRSKVGTTAVVPHVDLARVLYQNYLARLGTWYWHLASLAPGTPVLMDVFVY